LIAVVLDDLEYQAFELLGLERQLVAGAGDGALTVGAIDHLVDAAVHARPGVHNLHRPAKDLLVNVRPAGGIEPDDVRRDLAVIDLAPKQKGQVPRRGDNAVGIIHTGGGLPGFPGQQVDQVRQVKVWSGLDFFRTVDRP